MTIKSWSGDLVANSTLAGYQSDAEIAVLANGNIVAVWINFNATPQEATFRIFSPTGEPVSEEIVLQEIFAAPNLGLPYVSPSIAASPDGTFIITLASLDGSGITDVERFGHSKYTSDGTFISSNHLASNDLISPASPDSFTVIHSAGYPTFWTAFSWDTAAGSPGGLYLRVSNTSGSSLVYDLGITGEAGVKVDFDGTQLLALGTSGPVVLTWYNETTSFVQYGLYNQDNGAAITGVLDATYVSHTDPNPQVVALASGGFAIGYTSQDFASASSGLDVVIQLFDANGVPVGSPIVPHGFTLGDQSAFDMIALQDGGFMVVWQNDFTDAIYARTFDATGTPLTGDVLVSSLGSAYNVDQIDLALMQDGRVAMTWNSDQIGVADDVALKIIDPRDGVVTGRFDYLAGSSNVDDLLYGSISDDVVYALDGDDTVEGLEGNDILFGDAGNDTLYGGDGSDQLFGGRGDDLLFGEDGNDLFRDGLGSNTMFGGKGDDRFIVQSSGDNVNEDAGEGDDIIFATASYNLGAGAEVETLRTIYNAGTASIGLTGNELAQTIIGNAGDNSLNSGNGAPDTMMGGEGDDTYRVYNSADVVIEFTGEGSSDRVRTSVDYQLAGGVEVEFLTTNQFSGTDNLSLRGNELAQNIIGNAGANLLTDGFGAADTMTGGAGDDSYRIYNTGTEIIEQASGGSDRVLSSVDYTLNSGARVETISTNSFSSTATVNLTGNEFNQRVIGGRGDNRLSGAEGSDTLVSGAGDDVFVFDTAPVSGQYDQINDMNVALDQFELDTFAFTTLSTGVLAGNAFRANTSGAAFDTSDRIIHETDTGFIRYDADGSGAAASFVFAQVTIGLALTASDFDIV